MVTWYSYIIMRVIAIKKLRDFWESGRGDAEQPIKAWYHLVKKSVWKTPNDIKSQFKSASFIKDNRVVFNICGNKYRLIVHIRYDLQIIFVKFMGTHSEYDKIDANKI